MNCAERVCLFLQVAVFEKSAANLRTTKRGAGLGLDVNGQKALKAIKPGVVMFCNLLGALLPPSLTRTKASLGWVDSCRTIPKCECTNCLGHARLTPSVQPRLSSEDLQAC